MFCATSHRVKREIGHEQKGIKNSVFKPVCGIFVGG